MTPKKINIQLAALIFWMAIGAYGNPIMVEEGTTAQKMFESCLIFVNQETAKVSCKIGYKMNTIITPHIYLNVPVFYTVSQYQDIKETQKLVDVKIECEGISYEPRAVFSTAVDAEGYPFPREDSPDTKIEVGCTFAIKTPSSKLFSILVTYTQPVINGKVYYLPLFEKDSAPINNTDFDITFFTTSEFKLDLVTMHPDRSKVMRRRVSVCPKGRELIAIEINKDKTIENSFAK